MDPISLEEKQKNVQQAVELALIHRDIDDLRASAKDWKTGHDQIEREIKTLATQEDIKAIREQLDLLMPWAQTLQTLERLSKWVAAIAAAGGVVIAVVAWLRNGGGG